MPASSISFSSSEVFGQRGYFVPRGEHTRSGRQTHSTPRYKQKNNPHLVSLEINLQSTIDACTAAIGTLRAARTCGATVALTRLTHDDAEIPPRQLLFTTLSLKVEAAVEAAKLCTPLARAAVSQSFPLKNMPPYLKKGPSARTKRRKRLRQSHRKAHQLAVDSTVNELRDALKTDDREPAHLTRHTAQQTDSNARPASPQSLTVPKQPKLNRAASQHVGTTRVQRGGKVEHTPESPPREHQRETAREKGQKTVEELFLGHFLSGGRAKSPFSDHSTPKKPRDNPSPHTLCTSESTDHGATATNTSNSPKGSTDSSPSESDSARSYKQTLLSDPSPSTSPKAVRFSGSAVFKGTRSKRHEWADKWGNPPDRTPPSTSTSLASSEDTSGQSPS